MLTKSAKNPSVRLMAIALFLGSVWVLLVFFVLKATQKPAVSAISREGVVTQIQTMSRLTTVAFGVDTVITAQKAGTWQKLWQDEQKGLFVAKGRVLAGVDLSKITAEQVQVTFDEQTDKSVAPHAHIHITLPASQVFEVFLDDIQMYDWQTGLFGLVNNDPAILSQAQVSAKSEVLKKACQGNILTLAKDNAQEQIKGLFALSGATVVVEAPTANCPR